ncbi:hypothetical protein P0Y35_05735 [Kiritimatiellaeota bacterium B1221]|nr:hypothetical protein [Kiritimatiellaeota bacterium B1221]
MKCFTVLQFLLRIFTLLFGVIPASFLAPFAVVLLAGGLTGILWGGAALAGTMALWRVAFHPSPHRYIAIGLVLGMLSILPLVCHRETIFSIVAGPFYMALLNLGWMGLKGHPRFQVPAIPHSQER